MTATKVVWRTMGTAMQAALLTESSAAPAIPHRPTVAKNTVIFVPVGSEAEGAYLVALLKSTWANYLLRGSNVRGGKSSFATNLLDSLAIPEYRARGRAAELSRLGARAVEQARAGDERLEATEARIDEAAAAFWQIGRRQQEAMRASLAALG
jgi:hypothetical protein